MPYTIATLILGILFVLVIISIRHAARQPPQAGVSRPEPPTSPDTIQVRRMRPVPTAHHIQALLDPQLQATITEDDTTVTIQIGTITRDSVLLPFDTIQQYESLIQGRHIIIHIDRVMNAHVKIHRLHAESSQAIPSNLRTTVNIGVVINAEVME